MNRDEFISKYWKYYLVLEKQFSETLDFAEFHKDNYNTFSNHYAMLIQSIGAELDSFFKEFCKLAPDSFSNIGIYAEIILLSWMEIKEQKVEFMEKRLFLQPFKDWDKDKAKQSLTWWCAFDDIKHSRAVNFKSATQWNIVNILAALYMLEMKYLNIICDGKEPDLPEEPSRIFELVDWYYRYLPSAEGFAFVGGSTCMVDTRRVHWKRD